MKSAEIIDRHLRLVEACHHDLQSFVAAVAERIGATFARGGRVLACGNGGSAADAQHFAAELVGRFVRARRALPALALTTDTSTLTAIGNDFGFERIFARQVEAHGREGDLLLAISTSGNSPNVLEAARCAHQQGMSIVALTGEGGGRLAAAADVLLAVPSTDVARIQEVHELALHAIVAIVEERLDPTEPHT